LGHRGISSFISSMTETSTVGLSEDCLIRTFRIYFGYLYPVETSGEFSHDILAVKKWTGIKRSRLTVFRWRTSVTCSSQTHWRRSCQWTTQVVRPIQARPLIRTLFSAPLTVLSQLSSTGPQRHSTRHTTASWSGERSLRSEGKLEFIKQK
jgi:hypothetical protein